jgi:hypothetical protein
LGGTVSFGVRFQPNLSVPHGAKLASFKDNAPEVIRKLLIPNPVNKDRAYSNLTF